MHANAETQLLEGDERGFSFGVVAKKPNEILIETNALRKLIFYHRTLRLERLRCSKEVDHSRFRFKCLCIECQNLEKSKGYLQQYDYELVEQLSYLDYLFRDKKGIKNIRAAYINLAN